MIATQSVSLCVSGDTSAPREARSALEALRVPLAPRQRDDLRLALTELVTDCVVRGRSDAMDIQITVYREAVRVDVVSAEPSAPRFTRNPPPRERELQLVDRVASRWGTRGASAWFEMDLG
jgi:hypothetical protein